MLDDLHTVTDAECLSSIDYALSHLPTNVDVIVTTRVDPALRLARLRASGALAELRADELALTPAEARELLVTRGRVELGEEEIDALVERTEGWPAALVLAGLWLRTVDDPVRAVHAFGGGHRFVAEYLSSEVLASLDDDRRSFLQGVAVLGEFTADLCDGVLDRTDSAAQLTELEHANLFVSRFGRGGWFRIHSLFAEYARAQLASIGARCGDADSIGGPPSGSEREGCRSRRSSMRPRRVTTSSSRSCSSSTTCRWSGMAAAERCSDGFARFRTTASPNTRSSQRWLR